MILEARAPFDGAALLAFLAHRAVPGVEEVVDGSYRRSLRLGHGAGIVALSPAPGGMRAELDLDDERDEGEALAQLSALLDLDADPAAIAEVLGRDPVLGFTPGVRVPGAVDGYEIAVRAVLGQQISVRAASTHAGRLVHAAGEPLARPRGAVTHLFPAAEAIRDAPDAAFAMPERRRDDAALARRRAARRSDRPAGDRALDAVLRRDARTGRSRRLAADRPRRAPRARTPRARRRRRALAPVPRVRGHPPVGEPGVGCWRS